MKLYTKTGDDGTTGLYGGDRVAKDSARVEAYGTIDEANAAIGLAVASGLAPESAAVLTAVLSDLFVVGAELACAPGKEHKLSMRLVDEADAARLERAIDEAEAQLAPMKHFVLPGGAPQAAHLHLARTISRRAERAALAAGREAPVRREVLVYLNRLSDLLFVLSRLENQRAGVPDVPWTPRA
ncbi:MAG: cob(I)yrinic acid a,c-diamide adenosyltransferase [Polyangiaceae bacterium]|nr:cob(I)yrinic acid a,c-diamide adenosyltransferase [Polyangiaceae bacterium]